MGKGAAIRRAADAIADFGVGPGDERPLFVTRFLERDDLGAYTVGAKLPAIMALAVVTFRMAFMPIAMDALHSDEGLALYRFMAQAYLGLGFSAVLLLTLSAPFMVGLFASAEYFDGYKVVDVLAMTSVFYGFVQISQGGILKTERRRLSQASRFVARC